jgi:type IV secretory pathway TraG/TraD family ATPase VirD4
VVDAAIYSFLVGPSMYHLGLSRNGLGELIFMIGYDVVINYGWGRFFASRSRSPATLHRRGTVISPWTSVRGRQPAGGAGITLADIPVPPQDEVKHFKILGATGTGKSTAIRELLHGALARGDRAIIADPDGGYLDLFYVASRGDAILNPFEPDARKWDLFGELTHSYDVEQLARSLIPDIGGEDRIWSEYARTFFAATAQQLVRVNVRDDRELHRLIRSAPIGELRKLLAGTSAGPFLDEGSEKMFGSLRSVASSAVRVLEYTTEQQARPFSVRQWVREGRDRQAGGPGGVLFLPYRASQIAALRSVISAWMRLGIFEAMDRPAGDQRLWFIVDELDALGAIDGLKDALARLRKFGGRCVLGFQSIAQVSGTYGRETADTLVENCGNTLILRCSASERGGTSEFASKLIGQREVLHTTESRSRKPDEWLSSRTTSQQVRIEPAVMASEIEQLPDLCGFLKLASARDWKPVRLTPLQYPSVARQRGAEPAATSTPSAGAAVSADGSTAITEPPSQAGQTASNGASAEPEAPALAKPVGKPPGGAELPH